MCLRRNLAGEVPNRVDSDLVEFGPNSAKFGPTPVDIAPTWRASSEFAQTLSNPGLLSPEIANTLSISEQR